MKLTLFNFRMPQTTKHAFSIYCAKRNVSMTSQLNIIIDNLIKSENLNQKSSDHNEDFPSTFFITR